MRSSKLSRRLLAGAGAFALLAATAAAAYTASNSGARTISLYNIHSKETVTVLFKQNGQFIPDALEKINWVMRDWRRNEATKMDPALIDLLWEIHSELGSKEPIHIISAFRSRATNDMLRKTVGGQASESRHILGKAADVHFPDVLPKNLRYAALIRERGGVGFYPTSAIPFVHIDTDRVRAWPRLPRYELALLFPNGRTQHQPADGGPITPDDVRVAQSRYKELATQVAEFLGLRKTQRDGVAVAALQQPNLASSFAPQPVQRVAAVAPPLPSLQLIESPRVVDRPSQLSATRPSASERRKLSDLAALASAEPAPQLVREPAPVVRRLLDGAALPSLSGGGLTNASLPALAVPESPRIAAIDRRLPGGGGQLSDIGGFSTGFVQAPAFDDEHPDELSYRPFPIAPFMTETASADDAALVKLYHPDVAKTLELLDQGGAMPPMRLRPGLQVAEMMYSQQFKGEAINLTLLTDGRSADSPAPVANRKVPTTSR